jgi:hypothetical protein
MASPDLADTGQTTAGPGREHSTAPMDDWFGLSYSSYQVLHRTLMQSMPVAWQQRMAACLGELRDAFAHVPQPECYIVEPARETTYDDLNEADCEALGIEVGSYVGGFYDRNGIWHEGHERVLVPAGPDAIPPYRRGYVKPRLPAEADDDAVLCAGCGNAIPEPDTTEGVRAILGGGRLCPACGATL